MESTQESSNGSSQDSVQEHPLDKVTKFLKDLNFPKGTKLADLGEENLAKIEQMVPTEYWWMIADRMGVPEPLRFHPDNCLLEGTSYEDIIKCVQIISVVRTGVSPLQIPGLIEFAQSLSQSNMVRFLCHGMRISGIDPVKVAEKVKSNATSVTPSKPNNGDDTASP